MTSVPHDDEGTDRTSGQAHRRHRRPHTRRRSARSQAMRPFRVVRDAAHVRRAFGAPVVQDGVTLVPVAAVWGGAGGGWGSGEGAVGKDAGDGAGDGGGGGIAVRVRPVGVYVVSGGRVQWQPSLDLGRVIAGGQVVVAVVALAIAFGRRRRRR